jgi:hypothetical protein
MIFAMIAWFSFVLTHGDISHPEKSQFEEMERQEHWDIAAYAFLSLGRDYLDVAKGL